MKQPVVRTFAERVSRGKLGPDLQVIYRVAGGMPSERLEYEIKIDSVGGAKITSYDAQISRTIKHGPIASDVPEVADLFKQIVAGLHSLLPASRATFLPDALVGSITIRVDDEEETFYFVPEVEKRRTPEKRVAPPMELTLQRFWDMAKGVTEGQQKGAKYE
jgi:hypothetical protein